MTGNKKEKRGRERKKNKEGKGEQEQKGKRDVLRHEDQKSFILISGACKEKQEGCRLLACACIYIWDDAFPLKDLNCEDATNEATPFSHSWNNRNTTKTTTATRQLFSGNNRSQI